MPSTLFLGGARSGKSRLAQGAAEASGGPLASIATATAGDDEMAEGAEFVAAGLSPRLT